MTDFDLQMSLAKLSEALLPDDEMRQQKANAAAISRDGDVIPAAVKNAIPWQRIIWYLDSPVAGTNVNAEHPLPQGALIRQISVRAKSAPSGGHFRVTVSKGSGDPVSVSLQAGETAKSVPVNEEALPGGVLTLNVANVSGASGITVTVFYGGLT